MERRHFLKLAVGFTAAATATTFAAAANAAPLPPVSTVQGLVPPRSEAAEPAVVAQDEVDRLKPEQVRYGHHWHRHHWHHRHWHHRHWGWHRRWHRRHWRRWHRRHY
jgi:hypothetical protein